MIALIGAGCNGFYIWAGGPEKSVKIIKKLHRDNK
jgi:galactokinase/mevalonate kinase-like predicted kinase